MNVKATKRKIVKKPSELATAELKGELKTLLAECKRLRVDETKRLYEHPFQRLAERLQRVLDGEDARVVFGQKRGRGKASMASEHRELAATYWHAKDVLGMTHKQAPELVRRKHNVTHTDGTLRGYAMEHKDIREVLAEFKSL